MRLYVCHCRDIMAIDPRMPITTQDEHVGFSPTRNYGLGTSWNEKIDGFPTGGIGAARHSGMSKVQATHLTPEIYGPLGS